jgi:hypothetical protein
MQASVTNHALTLRERPDGSRTMAAGLRVISSSSVTACASAARSVSRASRQFCGDKISPQQRPNAQRGTQPPVHPTTVASIAILGFIGTGIAYVLTYQIIISEGATIASTVTYCRRWSPSSSASWS